MTLRIEDAIAGVDEWYEQEYVRRQRECDQAHNRVKEWGYNELGDFIMVFEGTEPTEQKITRISADIELCAKCSKLLKYPTKFN